MIHYKKPISRIQKLLKQTPKILKMMHHQNPINTSTQGLKQCIKKVQGMPI